MAGERLHPEGWTEISAVCTDVDFRGQGLAGRLVRAVAAGIRARGEQALLHAAAENAPAISVYLGLGFRLRRHTSFRLLRTPGVADARVGMENGGQAGEQAPEQAWDQARDQARDQAGARTPEAV
jgi:ribosomal protein S18 acetylase RimI-like enzyme